METGTRFDRDTAVESVREGGFEGRIDRGWWIHRGPNGGYVAAILLRALTRSVSDSERHARSFTLHFTAPPSEGPVRIETRLERAGRSLTTASGRMWQGERLCAVGIAAFSRPRPGPEFQDRAMPEVPPPERAEPLQGVGPHRLPIRDRYEQRSVIEPATGQRSGVARSGGWIRLTEPRVADAPLIAAFTDSWPPAVRHRLERSEWAVRGVPTIDLTVHFRVGLPLARAKPEDFHLAIFCTTVSREGFLEEDGEIWSASGVLLAQSRQIAVFL